MFIWISNKVNCYSTLRSFHRPLKALHMKCVLLTSYATFKSSLLRHRVWESAGADVSCLDFHPSGAHLSNTAFVPQKAHLIHRWNDRRAIWYSAPYSVDAELHLSGGWCHANSCFARAPNCGAKLQDESRQPRTDDESAQIKGRRRQRHSRIIVCALTTCGRLFTSHGHHRSPDRRDLQFHPGEKCSERSNKSNAALIVGPKFYLHDRHSAFRVDGFIRNGPSVARTKLPLEYGTFVEWIFLVKEYRGWI